jgi:hypothetical protein
MFKIAEPVLMKKIPGRPFHLPPIDQFFVLLVWLTSGMTYREIALHTTLSRSCISRVIAHCLECLPGPFYTTCIPRSLQNVFPQRKFDNHPGIFGIVDASPIFIERPTNHQEQFYSGKYKRHCVKVQVLVTADGYCVHLSRVYRGAAHDKRIFDDSGLRQALRVTQEGSESHRHGNSSSQCLPIMGDLGYQGIQRSCPGAVLPHKKPPGGHLTREQKEANRLLSHDRVLVDNFLG